MTRPRTGFINDLAQRFTTGSSPYGYKLTHVDAILRNRNSADPTYEVRVHPDWPGGTPTATLPTQLGTLMTPPNTDLPGNFGTVQFTASGNGIDLAANTTYLVVFDQTGATLDTAFSPTTSNAEDGGAAAGWSIADNHFFYSNVSNTWTTVGGNESLRIAVHGYDNDTTAPTFVTGWADGTALTLAFDEPLGAAASLANTAFAVQKRAEDGTQSSVDLSTSTAPSVSGSTVVLTLDSALAATDRDVTVSYTKPDSGTGNRIVDAAGNEADSFSGYVADVLVSNINQPTHSTTLSVTQNRAQIFTTGSHSTGYTLGSVEVKFATAPSSDLRVRVVDAPTGITPGTTEIATLTNPSSLTAGNLRFTAPAGTTLAADTDYAIFLDSGTSGTINVTTADEEDSGGASDWSVRNNANTGATGGGSVNAALQIRVSGTRNPVPLVSNIKQSMAIGTQSIGVQGAERREAAVTFTTGPGEAGYTLAEVDAGLTSVSSDAAPKVSVFSTSGGNPDSSLYELTNPATVGNGVQTFTAPAGTTLEANTTYAVVFAETSGKYSVRETSSNDEDAGAVSDAWEIGDVSRNRDAALSTSAWTLDGSSRVMRIAVRGRAEDRTPPTLAHALVHGDKVTLTYNEALGAAANLANDAFGVTKAGSDGTAVDVSLSTSTAPAVSGKTVVLTLASTIGGTDRGFKVSYTKPTTGTGNRIVNAAALAADSFTDQVAARVLVSNVGQAEKTGSVSGIGLDYAQPFTVGSNAAGYTLTHAAIKLVRTSTEAPTYTVSIHPDSSNAPGSSSDELTNPASLPATTTDVVFTAAGDGIELTAGTYWLVWDVDNVNSATGKLLEAASGTDDSGAATGWSVGDTTRNRAFSSTTWSSVQSTTYQIAIYGHIKEPPMVTGVEITSTPTHDVDGDGTRETYGLGETIQVQVTFDKAVTVDTTGGTPRLKIKMAPMHGEFWADYESGPTTKVLTFGYTVAMPNKSQPGVAVLANTLELNSGTIKDATDASLNANLAHTGQGHNSAHRVDWELESTAPQLTRAVVDGRTLTLTFSQALDESSKPVASDFAVMVAGSRRTVVDVDVRGSTVILTLATAVAEGATVTVSYTAGTNPVRRTGGGGDPAGSFTGEAVTNVTGETPTLETAVVHDTTLTLLYDEDLDTASVPVTGDFAVTVAGAARDVTAVAIPAAPAPTTVALTLANPAVTAGQAVRVSYTKGTNPIRDTHANQYEAADLVRHAVTNLASDTTGPQLRAATVQDATLTLTYNEWLNPVHVPLIRHFAVSDNHPTSGGPLTLTGVVVRGRTVELTLSATVTADAQVHMTYALGDDSQTNIQDFAGNPAGVISDRTFTHGPPPSSGRSPGGGGTPGGGGGRGGGRGGGGGSDRHGNSVATATPITFRSATPRAGSIAGQINTRSDVDYFRLRLAQAGVLLIETNGNTDTQGTVWQAGAELGAATDGGPGANFRLATPVEAGDVVIAIAGEGGRTGEYTLRARLVVGYVENPTARSFQSGLGLISGWVCEAAGVTVEIEKADGTVVELAAAYGTERADTAGVCGDSDNGFGVLVNWNLLDDGDHTVRVLVNGVALGTRVVPGVGVVPAVVDGIELGRAPVTVTTLGAEFVEGLEGSLLVADFPRAGEQVRVVWQESQQNFVLAPVEGEAVAGPGPGPGGIDGVLENPRPASYQSGIGVISGWVSEAEEVVIEIDGQAIAAAAGTERADTLDVCGDVDNGFGLLVNWAEFGAGEHEVVALVDGVELSRATVTVTMVDATEPFVRGLTKRVEVADFPTPDETVTLEWRESQQNFVITGVD